MPIYYFTTQLFLHAVLPSALNVSVTTIGSSVAGESYKLVCTASVIEGIEATPQSLQWLDTDGQQIQSDSDISVGTARLENGTVILPLQFGVLRVFHTGEYTCQATVFLPGLDPIVTMTTSYVNVESKYTQFHAVDYTPLSQFYGCKYLYSS